MKEQGAAQTDANKNEKSSFEASGFPLFFFEGGGSNVCKPGDEINEREQWDKKEK